MSGKVSYQFSNLLGTVHRRGNLLFSRDSQSIITPVGNRVTLHHLTQNTSVTLPHQTRHDVHRVCLNNSGDLLMMLDVEGRCITVNLDTGAELHNFNFGSRVRCLSFSPNDRFFFAGVDADLQVWRSPSAKKKQYAPFVLRRTYTGHYDDIICADWSPNSGFVVSGAKDLSVRVWAIRPTAGYVVPTLTAHRDYLVNVFFATDDQIISISKDSAIYVWQWKASKDKKKGKGKVQALHPAFGRWSITHKHYFSQGGRKVKRSALHKQSQLLVLGFGNGVFTLYQMPEATALQSLSVSRSSLSSVCISPSGDWLGIGCARLGQVVVWEWQSESYVLKQQGHAYDVNSAVWSPDGQLVASSSDDGKVKVWNTDSGYCFVTFREHKAPVSQVVFSPKGNAIFTAALDGTCRAFDLVRYRNFRTFVAPDATQFSCICVDPSGEVVCAGGVESLGAFVWNVQTGELLEQLAGHEAPVSSVAFSPSEPILATASWDCTVMLWDLFRGHGARSAMHVLRHSFLVLDVAWRPDGQQLAVSTLGGNIHFWSRDGDVEEGVIEGRNDIWPGRKVMDAQAAARSSFGKCFATITYSSDGRSILGAGESKWVCLYNVEQRLLVKKWQVTRNQSLDGVRQHLDTRKLTEAGPVEMLDVTDDDDNDGLGSAPRTALPGVERGTFSSHAQRPAMRVREMNMAGTGEAFVLASTEGISVYSLDSTVMFDPFQLDASITPQAVADALQRGEHVEALVMSLRLNQTDIIRRVFVCIPHADVSFSAQQLPFVYVKRMVQFLAAECGSGPHLALVLLWCRSILTAHGAALHKQRSSFMAAFRGLMKAVRAHQEGVANAASQNAYMLRYVCDVTMKEDETSDTIGGDEEGNAVEAMGQPTSPTQDAFNDEAAAVFGTAAAMGRQEREHGFMSDMIGDSTSWFQGGADVRLPAFGDDSTLVSGEQDESNAVGEKKVTKRKKKKKRRTQGAQ